ncbi:metal ABC transporter solute-binding protein, Zn/Mn family [Microbacterium sp. C7(2022)]|uniref:metal ABC transporter solute-binding protein, Zn/Mn family n=1 Tax=Microbacterium sp. C7(2022) TaxID=2992759 RepID=UPI00237BABDB|nr:zinc ABC transporter substrate-binding protein [Microbacterium sp. C7(2022)]MDE0546385.1 zinc ABC transporter substrate-binding protein [Microbacterium sp. C7(2022)]
MNTSRSLSLLGLGAASALALTGCAAAADTTETAANASDDVITVVASTNVYGQIAEEIGGDSVEVTSIITNAAQDPHSFEASARDQLTVSDADLVIENGGGYDGFMDAIIESTETDAHVITAVEFSHDWPENDGHDDAEDEHSDDEDDDHAEDDHDHADHGHVEGFNEHVWYDPHTMVHVAEAIADELTELDPEAADVFAANFDAFAAEIEALEASLAEIDDAHDDEHAFLTEPVAGYLVAEAGLENVTPDAFSEAVEEGQDVPPATLLEALDLIADGDVRVVVTNTQTGGAETERVVSDAESAGIPVVAFSETLPEGQTYISWMQSNIVALQAALEK